MDLKTLRKKINEIDLNLLNLLIQRANLAKKVGEHKRKNKSHFYIPEREEEIINNLKKLSEQQLPNFSIENIYREIFSSCRELEKEIVVAYLGPPATFTHSALLKKFGSCVKQLPQKSVEEVFISVSKENVNYGVVPIENSSGGVVGNTLDMFYKYIETNICGETYLQIKNHLMAKCKLSQIKKVYSHSQPFIQASNWINKNLGRHIELIEVSSTSFAAEKAAKEKYTAAIASKLAAKIYKLNILAENIDDFPQNKTRFLIIGKQTLKPTGKDKTSLMFSVPHKSGALFTALSPLKKHQINMTLIESRPKTRAQWEYVFFIDIQGHSEEEKISKALKEIKRHCSFLKILGSYPEAK